MTETAVPTTAADIEREARTLRATLTAYAALAEPLTVMEGRHILAMVADMARIVADHEFRIKNTETREAYHYEAQG